MFRRLALALFCLVPLAASAHGPSRQKVEQEIDIKAPPAKVWALLADFCSIAKWNPGIVKCEATQGSEVGSVRTLSVGKADGPQIIEELQMIDPAQMTLKYKITKTDVSILPVATYASWMTVTANDDGSAKVTWKGAFYRSWTKNNPPADQNDEAAVKAVTGAYTGGLASLKKYLEK